MPRAALAFAPTLGYVEPGRDAYVSLGPLRTIAAAAVRWWTFHSVPTTVELSGRPSERYAKLWDRFTEHGEEGAMRELLREYESFGVNRPGGYADVFHDQYNSFRVAWSVNSMLAPAFAGGWQAALKTGAFRGVFYKYDLRSAYMWAGSLGMPDPKTYRRSTVIRSDRDGVYRVILSRPVSGAPFPFFRARECLVTNEEIETYSLPVERVVTGVTWGGLLDPAKMLDAIRLTSTWKQTGRSYWGRWGQTTRVECHCRAKSWVLPNIAANVPWAHLIVSRVKSKLWQAADASTVHVYVDSLLTQKRLATGSEIGDWKLEKTYRNGVLVRGPGQYGDLKAERLERMAGVPKDSRLRDILANRYVELLRD